MARRHLGVRSLSSRVRRRVSCPLPEWEAEISASEATCVLSLLAIYFYIYEASATAGSFPLVGCIELPSRGRTPDLGFLSSLAGLPSFFGEKGLRGLTASTLQWTVGVFYVVSGTMMLVAPHQFDSLSYASMQPDLNVWGAAFLLLGMSLLAVVVLAPPRPFVLSAHLLAGVGLLVLAYGFVRSSGWTGAINFAALGFGTALVPFLGTGQQHETNDRPDDLLPLVSGAGALLTGAVILLLPGQFNSPIYAPIRSYLFLLGIAFLASGAFAAYVHLRHSHSRTVLIAAHLVLGGTLLAFFLVSAVPLRAWLGMAYYGGFGVVIALLPGLSAWLYRFDLSSLQVRLVIAFALAASLPLITAVAVITDQQERSVTSRTLAFQEGIAAASASGVKDYLDIYRTAIAQVALDPGLIQRPPEEQRALLESVATLYPDALAFATHDREGNPIAWSGAGSMVPMAGYPIFEETRQTKRPSLDVFISPVFHRLVISIAAPVIAPGGEFAGMVRVTIEPARLNAMLEDADPGMGTDVSLVDSNGQVLTSSEDPAVQVPSRLEAPEPVAAMLAAPEDSRGSIRYGAPGDRHMASFARIGEPRWGVIVDTHAAVALADIHAQRDTAFVILFACLLVALGGGVFAANLLAHPLNALARAADRFSAGDARAALPVSSVRQVGSLASAFGEMRDKLVAQTAERERLLAEVRRQADELNTIIDSVAVGIAILDGEGRAIHMNPAAGRMVGLTADEIALPPEEMVRLLRVETPDGRPLIWEESAVVRSLKGETVQGEVLKMKRKGTDVWVSASAAPIRDSEGGVMGAVVSYADITSQRALQEQREDFMRAVSHDLRNPLSAVLGQAQLLQRKMERAGIDPSMIQSVKVVETGARRMNAMIGDLAESISIESGQLRLDSHPVNLPSFIFDLLHRSSGALATDRVMAEIPPDLPRVEADPNRLERIVLNLISNALKYSDPGSEVVLRAEGMEGHVEVSVVDRGRGIEPEDIPHLFERFYRAKGARNAEGLGLGLYITRMLVEAQGGTIRVESEVGVGSRFSFTLPTTD